MAHAEGRVGGLGIGIVVMIVLLGLTFVVSCLVRQHELFGPVTAALVVFDLVILGILAALPRGGEEEDSIVPEDEVLIGRDFLIGLSTFVCIAGIFMTVMGHWAENVRVKYL
eukprot:m.126758 g.126758  ORF g.126758 m.126758 type:complete len:112 (-) comp14525_c1_seq1:97-432(-)